MRAATSSRDQSLCTRPINFKAVKRGRHCCGSGVARINSEGVAAHGHPTQHRPRRRLLAVHDSADAPLHQPRSDQQLTVLGVGIPPKRRSGWRGQAAAVPRTSHHHGPSTRRPNLSLRIPRSHGTEPVTDPTRTRSRILPIRRGLYLDCRLNHPQNTPPIQGWLPQINNPPVTTSSKQSEIPYSSGPQNSPPAPGPVAPRPSLRSSLSLPLPFNSYPFPKQQSARKRPPHARSPLHVSRFRLARR